MPATVPFQDIKVPAPGLGCMSFSGSWGEISKDDSHAQLSRALELGCTFWDSAVAYDKGGNEALIGEWFAKTGNRDKIFIASKCGIAVLEDGEVNNSPEHINEYIEGTIRRLGSTPDLYYLHRIDPKQDLEASITALDKLKKDGKTRYIGLSECNAQTLRKACSYAHIDALQIEYSPWFVDHEQNGLIDTAREFGVTIVAYSPLGKGVLTGSIENLDNLPPNDLRRSIPRFQPEYLPANLRLVREFKNLADKKGCSPGQLAVAWVIAQGAIPIPGTRNPERLKENVGGGAVELSKEDLKELRTLIEDAAPKGDRYDPTQLARVGKSVELSEEDLKQSRMLIEDAAPKGDKYDPTQLAQVGK